MNSEDIKLVTELIEKKDSDQLKEVIKDLHPADIAELRGYLPDKIRIAACGGVRTLEQAVSLYAAGADRVCTGNSAHILAEAAALQRDGKALESVSAAV